MKKLFILAISAILVANVSAQEVKKVKKEECKKAKIEKRECNKAERVERDIKFLSEELYLSEEQAAKFAVTYREFIAEKEKLNKEFRAKFAKDLNERQVERVLHFKGPHPEFRKGPRPEFEQDRKHRDFPKEGPKKHAERD